MDNDINGKTQSLGRHGPMVTQIMDNSRCVIKVGFVEPLVYFLLYQTDSACYVLLSVVVPPSSAVLLLAKAISPLELAVHATEQSRLHLELLSRT